MRIVLCVLLMAMAGCSKSANETTVETPDGTVTYSEDKVVVQTDQGRTTIETSGGQTRVESNEGSVSITQNSVPEGFPIPVMSGAVIESSSHSTPPDGRDIYQLTIRSSAPVDQIAEFYQKAFEARGFETSRADQAAGGMKMVMVTGDAEGFQAMAMISKEANSDQATATLSLASREKGP